MSNYLYPPASQMAAMLTTAANETECDTGIGDVTWAGVGYSSTLIMVNLVTSLVLGLGLHWKLLISSVRCVVQLTLMGYILVPVLEDDNPYYVLGLSFVFLFLASFETAFHKGKRRYRGMFFNVFFSLFFSTAICTIIGTAFCMDADPFYEARQFVPTVGMILGNSMSAVALAINHVLDYVSNNKDSVEWMLSYGANWWEAGRPIAVEALRIGMLPTLNAMSVMGLISIPGMMTGQILAGAPPMTAVKYQQIIMFLMAAATCMATVSATLITLRVIFKEHRLRMKRIKQEPFVLYTAIKNAFVFVFCCGCRKKKKGKIPSASHSKIYGINDDEEGLESEQQRRSACCCWRTTKSTSVAPGQSDERKPLL